MRVPAALVTIPLLVGVVVGLLVADRGQAELFRYAAAAAVLAFVAAVGAFGLSDTATTVVASMVGCALAGVSLAMTSASGTYRPPLMRWFDARAP
ncbi:MAG: hypothetical protein ABIX28_16215, partial [Vicinamibacterales bacterium]